MENKTFILVGEDEPNDVFLFQRALRAVGFDSFHFVRDGQEVIDYLQGSGIYADRKNFPFPSCLMLDLKMPRRSGFDVLEWLQSHPHCSVIPTVVFSSSALREDIERAYRLGVSTYFQKRSNYEETTELLRLMSKYWCEAETPDPPETGNCNEHSS